MTFRYVQAVEVGGSPDAQREVQRLTPVVEQRREQMKEEMMGAQPLSGSRMRCPLFGAHALMPHRITAAAACLEGDHGCPLLATCRRST